MPAVKPFARHMIRTYLHKRELQFTTVETGDFVLRFAGDAETARWGTSLTVSLAAEGPGEQLYSIVVVDERRFPAARRVRLQALCNQWNREHRWPRAYLHLNEDGTGSLQIDGQLSLAEGIHQELFEDYSDTILHGAFTFWDWLHAEQGL